MEKVEICVLNAFLRRRGEGRMKITRYRVSRIIRVAFCVVWQSDSDREAAVKVMM